MPRNAVGATPIPNKDDPVAYPADGQKAKAVRKEQAVEAKGHPLNDPGVTHPTQTVNDTPAYRRADGTRYRKGE